MSYDINEGAKHLVDCCAAVSAGENALVLATESTRMLGQAVMDALSARTENATILVLPELKMHGNEPSSNVAEAMYCSDVIFCLTPMSLAHTNARMVATSHKARFLSLPDYSKRVLTSVALNEVDFEALRPVTDHLAENYLDDAKHVFIKTELGTDVTFSIEGRLTNRCPGSVRNVGELGSPPDAEVNLAPVEDTANGVIVIDGSVPCREIGVLEKPVKLKFVNGTVTEVWSDHPEMASTVDTINTLFDAVPLTEGGNPRTLGEFGIGLNKKANLVGIMLEDEGAFGTIHFGIGSNATIGGHNKTPFHLDFIMRDATVTLDDGTVLIEKGEIVGFEL